jgi:uncharacterized protein YxeA
MKKIISLFTALLITAGFSGFAMAEVEQGQAAESLISECGKQADAQQPQDRDAFINQCMDEKLGYEKDE